MSAPSASLRLPLLDVMLRARQNIKGVPGYQAAVYCRLRALRTLLSIWPAAAMQFDSRREPPLLAGIASKDLECMKELLLRYPEAVHATDVYGWSAAHYALRPQRTDMLRTLLSCARDAVIAGRYAKGDCIVHLAVRVGNTHTMTELLRCWPEGMRVANSFGQLPIHLAARNGRTDTLQVLLEFGPDSVMKLDRSGDSPVHLAARHGKIQALRVILRLFPSAATSVNAPGETPFDVAADGNTLIELLSVTEYPHPCASITLPTITEERQERVLALQDLLRGDPDGRTSALLLLQRRWSDGSVPLRGGARYPGHPQKPFTIAQALLQRLKRGLPLK